MNILFLTWKDIRHPHAGGAERVIYEYASRLIKRWHTVTWFASSFVWSKSEEIIDGIEIIRRYTANTIWMRAHRWYREYKKLHTIDVIIDEAGGWPLLSPLYEKEIPIFLFAHHIGDKEFDYNTDFSVLSPIVRSIAKWVYLKTFSVYKHTKAITVSKSTKNELIERFLHIPKNITVIENTTELHPISQIEFEKKTNNFVFLGRLTAIKRPKDAILAFSRARGGLPQDSKLHIIGNAQDVKYVESLKKLVEEEGMNDRVVFHGHMNKEQFSPYLQSSCALLVPSEKEGFWLIVLEANANWTPVIAYDVSGLRDSTKDGTNGVLVPYGDIEMMADAMKNMLANEPKYRTLCQSSLDHVQSIPTWDEQTDRLEKFLLSSNY